MRRPELAAVCVLAAILAFTGCGGDNGNGGFATCGNGVVDSGEECDDGNLIDQDGCLATCKLNVCGDTFLNQGVEECDDVAFERRCGPNDTSIVCTADADCPTAGDTCNAATCASFGFAGGTLTCTKECTFDTSACSGVPSTPTPVTGETPSPTAPTSTTSGGTPAATPTPAAGGVCNPGDQVVVQASVDKPYGGISFRLAYPPSSVNIPGSGTAQSVKDRVVLATAGGIQTIGDLDTDGNGVDDTVTVAVVDTNEHPAGLFATVTFDCVAGETRPQVSAFTCTIQSASTPDGIAIPDESCSVAIQ
jgi:cysteine-rich repeat protein